MDTVIKLLIGVLIGLLVRRFCKPVYKGDNKEIDMTKDERINQLEKTVKDLNWKYNEAMYVIWILDDHKEAQELLKRHGLWGKSVQKESQASKVFCPPLPPNP